jgi:hypothetical protein
MAAGQRLVQAQLSQLRGKAADVRGAQAGHRKALSILSRLAGELLRDAGHNATSDMMLRINSTLESLSAYPSNHNAPRPGRLTADVHPPGFESIYGLFQAAVPLKAVKSAQVVPFKPPPKKDTSKKDNDDKRIAFARELHDAEKALGEARAKADDVAAAQRKAAADASEAEKRRLLAGELYEKARLAEKKARDRLDNLAQEADKAGRVLDDAAKDVERAHKKLKDI